MWEYLVMVLLGPVLAWLFVSSIAVFAKVYEARRLAAVNRNKKIKRSE